jgi:copper homeostasis protein
MPATFELACFHREATELAQLWAVPRIEFCVEAKLGGTSPSASEVDRVRGNYHGELGVMVRPRGGDFVYSSLEFTRMTEELNRLARQGVDFVVLGALTEEGDLDPRTADLAELAAAHGIPWVLHRAFDSARDRFEALAAAESLGCTRILTGLGATSMHELVALRETAKLDILPGGGIRAHNAADYLEAGFRQIHSAALLNYESLPPLPDESETLAMLKLCHQH